MVAHLGCVGFNLSVPLLARSREDGNLAEVAEQHVRDAGINKGKSAQPGWRQHTQPCIYERLGLAGGRAESERGYALFIMAAFKADHFSNNESLRSEGRRTRTGASPVTHLTLPLPYLMVVSNRASNKHSSEKSGFHVTLTQGWGEVTFEL